MASNPLVHERRRLQTPANSSPCASAAETPQVEAGDPRDQRLQAWLVGDGVCEERYTVARRQ